MMHFIKNISDKLAYLFDEDSEPEPSISPEEHEKACLQSFFAAPGYSQALAELRDYKIKHKVPADNYNAMIKIVETKQSAWRTFFLYEPSVRTERLEMLNKEIQSSASYLFTPLEKNRMNYMLAQFKQFAEEPEHKNSSPTISAKNL